MSQRFRGDLSEAEQYYMVDHMAQTLFYLCSQLILVHKPRTEFKGPVNEGFGRLFTEFPGFQEKLPLLIELMYR